MELSLGLENAHVLVTGGAGLIGSKVVEAFIAAGARVTSLDISYKHDNLIDEKLLKIQVDTTSESSVEKAWAQAEKTFGAVQTCIALAALDLSVLPSYSNPADIPLEEFRRTIDVNVVGTFIVAQQWLRGLQMLRIRNAIAFNEMENVSLIIMGSESGHWGEVGRADYATSKAAVQYGLLQSLKMSAPKVHPRARVNSVAPGPVNTVKFKKECAERPKQYYEDCVATTAMGKPVEVEHVARSVLFLASERYSGAVHGQILNVDGGKLGKLVHGEDVLKTVKQ